MQEVLLGIDIGGTKCSIVIGSRNGQVLLKESFPTEQERGPNDTIDKILETGSRLVSEARGKLSAVGIACGSPLDPELGIIQAPPNLPTWVDVPIVSIIQRKFSVPVFLDNDANAGALAEYVFGAGRGYKNIVFITFGTGCGSGLILDGKIYRGTNCYAGEIGHIRLAASGPVGYHKAGSFEGFCSGGGIAQLARSMRMEFRKQTCLPLDPTAEDVGKGAFAGDELSKKVLEVSGYHLGLGLSYIIDILNPQRIIIGSIFLRCEKFLRPAMEEALSKEALPYARKVCEIVPAGLGERVGDLAALSVGHYGLERI